MSFDFDDNISPQKQDAWGFDFEEENYSEIPCEEEKTFQHREELEIKEERVQPRNRTKRNKKGQVVDVSGKWLTVGLPIVIVIILCIIFQKQITDFLMTVLSWIIIILILFIIIRIFIFPRRRR